MRDRILYFDALKCIAIISVITNHIILWGMNGLDCIKNTFWIITIEAQMPIFYFISGFFFVNSISRKNTKQTVKYILSKIPHLIISAFIFMSVYAYINGTGIIDCLSGTYKGGYWFSIILFLFYILGFIAKTIARKINILFFAICLSICIAAEISIKYLSSATVGYLSIDQWNYFFIFIVGMLASTKITTLQANPIYEIIVISSFFVLNVLHVLGFSFTHTLIVGRYILPLIDCAALLLFFFKIKEKFTTNNWINRSVSYVGTSTLEIYYLQFFFIPRNLSGVCTTLGLYDSHILLILFALILSTTTLALSIMSGNILRSSKYLSRYLFGYK